MEVKIDCKGYPCFLEYQKIKYKKPSFHRDTLEMIFVMKGDLEVEMEEDVDTLKAGDFMLINAGISHTLHGGKDTYITCLYLDLNYYAEDYPFIHGHSLYCKYQEGYTDTAEENLYLAIRNYFIRLMIVESMNASRKREIVSDICDIMMDIIINHVVDIQYIKNKISQLKEVDQERIFSMTEFLSKNWNRQGLTLTDLADHVNLSATRLGHFWKSATSITFMDTISLYRYNEAKRLLMNGIMSVSEISETCGYSDEKYLYKVFKDKHDMTPREFRNHHKEVIKKPDEYKSQYVADVYDFVSEYGKKYFCPIDEYSFLSRFPERVYEERRLSELYSVITKAGSEVNKNGKIGNNGVVISLGTNSGISMAVDKSVKINWEYIYAVSLITMTFFENCSLAVDIEVLGVDRWLDVFEKIKYELNQNWGRDFHTDTGLIVRYMGGESYAHAVELADEAKKSQYFLKAEPILNI